MIPPRLRWSGVVRFLVGMGIGGFPGFILLAGLGGLVTAGQFWPLMEFVLVGLLPTPLVFAIAGLARRGSGAPAKPLRIGLVSGIGFSAVVWFLFLNAFPTPS